MGRTVRSMNEFDDRARHAASASRLRSRGCSQRQVSSSPIATTTATVRFSRNCPPQRSPRLDRRPCTICRAGFPTAFSEDQREQASARFASRLPPLPPMPPRRYRRIPPPLPTTLVVSPPRGRRGSLSVGLAEPPFLVRLHELFSCHPYLALHLSSQP